jgi:inner membrane protein
LDSVTHIVVGGALGELALGKKIGNKAVIVGAIANTIPDLDVFAQAMAKTPEAAIRIHRSYTHALFTHPFMALPFAWLTYILFKKKLPFMVWYLFFLLGFFTHVMMDCCTTYGTQLLLPFTNKLISWNNLAVVDPLYTLPCILFFFVVFFIKKENNLRRYLALSGITLSLLYLTTATVNKFTSATFFKKQVAEKNIHVTHFSTTPTMFTSWLWNMVAYDDSTMYLAEHSTFQKSDKMELVSIPRNTQLLQPYANTRIGETMVWFSQGYYFLEHGSGDTLNYYITKWGRGDISSTETRKMFPFYAKVYTDKNGKVTFKQIEPNFSGKDFKNYFSMIGKRIFHYD